MRKGTLLYNNWLLCGAAILIIVLVALVSAWQGHMALEFGGLELSFTPHEEGGLRLSLLKTA